MLWNSWIDLNGTRLPMTETALLQATNVRKHFGQIEVLKGIDLTVRQGQVVSLIGASGSGKTTFLRCVNLLEEHDGGEILLDGDPIGYRMAGETRKRLSETKISAQRARIGMVFQQFNLFPHLTAGQNVMLGLTKVQGRSAAEAREIADHWLGRVGLGERRDHYPYQLSGGQQQRVAIARAVAMQPRLLLFDEVTSALDPELVAEVLGVMQALAESGMTMLLVSHEMLFVREVSHHVLFLDQGRVAQEGKPSEVFDNPESERLRSFLGRFHGIFSR
ncbi:glutamine transporter subunit; ATP-binding component of ABC superfamily [Bosea sp. 62]|nr:glutamine transporter subunit; ATP-binding component of ABC superfamily [Bosea sp. 21B]CAD5286780.1 glutamine transporter subunit; ATP-binding component of ABC superfamily [Bosea sp. 7B]CAD5301261.1 glutamine transporter subunit; ATP-binding component of ABC superfamily [Bosea sp. 46]VVT57362.1 glutamine transporter subunit; ATP-binding component of ABC superfamily [Bosea sp. EC-HK365B]VXB67042.1 glutamine transporter subunit; ATP-binding component of ABC superfamily [Bosea sp. 125]VXC69332